MDIYDVVKKLTGEIVPVGSTHIDDQRFDNLELTIGLVDRLLSDIDTVAQQKTRVEASIKKAGERASKFFNDMKIRNT